MSPLALKMISDVHAKTTAKLAAIEAGAGKIEEAETLAATLRSFGISNAKARGFAGSTGVWCWVTAYDTQPDALRQALADADLRIARIERDGKTVASDIFLDGLDTPINTWAEIFLDGLDTPINTWAEIAAAMQSSEEPAHA